jgi:hypothetical protein
LEASLHGRAYEAPRDLFPAPFKLEGCAMIWKTPNMADALPGAAMRRFRTAGLKAIMLR